MIFKTGVKVIVNDKGVNKLGIITRKSYHSNLQDYRYKVMLENKIVHYKVPVVSSDVKDKPLFYINKDLSKIASQVTSRLSLIEGNVQRNKWNSEYYRTLALES